MSDAWEVFESHVVNITSGRLTNASGRFSQKGDVHTDTLLIECKLRTVKDTKTWKEPSQDWLDTVTYQAKKAKKIPILAYRLDFKSLDPPRDYYLCRSADYELITGYETYESSPWVTLSRDELVDYCRRKEEEKPPEKKGYNKLERTRT